MKLINGTIKYAAGKEFPSKKNGQSRQNIVIDSSEGELTLWFNAGRHPHSTLPKGASVQVFKDGDRLTLLEEDSPTSEHDPPPTPRLIPTEPYCWSDDHRRHIHRELRQRAAILAACHREMQQHFTDPETGESTISTDAIAHHGQQLYRDLALLWRQC